MFNLDTEAAKTSDTMSTRIDKSAIYTGAITRAEWSKSQTSQAEFMNIDFTNDEGLTANYMSICFKKGDGTNSFGYNIINKIMACCSLRQLNKQQVGEKVVCPELTNARIKFALQAEADWYKDKTTGEYKPTINMVISTPFKSDSGQTAKEVLEQSQAVTINTFVVNDRKPKDKPVETQQQSWGNAPQQSANKSAPAYNQPAPQQPVDDLSDIPF